MNNSTIIFLNGPSSSGKSSIQKSLQKIATQNVLRIGIDTFFDALIKEPDLSSFKKDKKFDQFTPQGEYIRGIKLQRDDSGNPVVPLKVGPAGERIIFGMHRAIRAYAEAGNNVIVDYILYNPAWIKDLAQSLKDHRVYFIKIHAPLEVIEQREKDRNTSPPGHARSHYGTVHQGMVYDLDADTSENTPEEAAKRILDFIQSHEPQALQEMLAVIK
jgi:chloramphenicol 3-O phosphotransferase